MAPGALAEENIGTDVDTIGLDVIRLESSDKVAAAVDVVTGPSNLSAEVINDADDTMVSPSVTVG